MKTYITLIALHIGVCSLHAMHNNFSHIALPQSMGLKALPPSTGLQAATEFTIPRTTNKPNPFLTLAIMVSTEPVKSHASEKKQEDLVDLIAEVDTSTKLDEGRIDVSSEKRTMDSSLLEGTMGMNTTENRILATLRVDPETLRDVLKYLDIKK